MNSNSQSASSSPINRSILSAGNASHSDDEILNLVKYLKENVNRLQLLIQKYTNDGNNDKLRQAQAVHQQIIQFVNNPTLETLNTAKHLRDMLDRIPVISHLILDLFHLYSLDLDSSSSTTSTSNNNNNNEYCTKCLQSMSKSYK